MTESKFNHISCGQTLPPNNIHAVSVSMPKLQDVIDYEEQNPEILKKIKSAYPRFILHPYLKILANYMKKKYKIPNDFEVVLLSSQKAVNLVSDKYFIHNKITIKEPFGVILVQKNTSQLNKVLSFVQYVGYNLSSRFAQEYLYKIDLLKTKHIEEYEKKELSEEIIKNRLSLAYKQKKDNVCLTTSGMNAIYSVLKGIKKIQEKNSRQILIQFGWLYLDTTNIVKHYFNQTKIFYDINNLTLLENYLKNKGLQVSALITEIPTNPLLDCVALPRLKKLCEKYNIPIIIDTTLSTPYILDLKKYADIYVESLTKFACGNADVLMGAIILNENSKISFIKEEFFKHCDKPYIKDLQRLAYEIKNYENRVKKISSNTKDLISYLKTCPYVKKIYYCKSEINKKNFEELCFNKQEYVGLISLEFNKPLKQIYDKLNFAKGPSLGTEFTLLMPYTYLAHYDLIQKNRSFLKKIKLPIELLRISVGCEDINEIINEFKKLTI